jgi:uncharacterized protein
MIRQFLPASLAMGVALLLCPFPSSAKVPPKNIAPSFNCAKARARSIDTVICASRELSMLDRSMAQDYRRAQTETPRAALPELWDEQREFIANRNLCMNDRMTRHACIAFSYESRIERLAEWIDGTALD